MHTLNMIFLFFVFKKTPNLILRIQMEFISLLGGYSCAHSIMGSKSLEVIKRTTNSGGKIKEAMGTIWHVQHNPTRHGHKI